MALEFATFTFWWSVLSTIIALLLFGWDIWQLASNRKEKDIHKAEVKLWLHHAAGLMQGIIGLVRDEFSTVSDMKNAMKTCQASSYSLYQSLNEERLFTEAEIKERQLKAEQEANKRTEMPG